MVWIQARELRLCLTQTAPIQGNLRPMPCFSSQRLGQPMQRPGLMENPCIHRCLQSSLRVAVGACNFLQAQLKSEDSLNFDLFCLLPFCGAKRVGLDGLGRLGLEPARFSSKPLDSPRNLFETSSKPLRNLLETLLDSPRFSGFVLHSLDSCSILKRVCSILARFSARSCSILMAVKQALPEAPEITQAAAFSGFGGFERFCSMLEGIWEVQRNHLRLRPCGSFEEIESRKEQRPTQCSFHSLCSLSSD